MARNRNAEEVWLHRESQRDPYKKLFRFDKLTSPLGSSLWTLYTIGSRFGVHGHVSFTDDPAGWVTIGGNEFVILPPGKDFNLSCYQLSLATVHSFMCAFLEQHGDSFHDLSDAAIRHDALLIVRDLAAIQIPWPQRGP